MTGEKSELKDIKKILLSREEFHPFPTYTQRAAWEKLPQRAKEQYLSKEDELLHFESSALSAVKYMGYYRTNYAGEYHAHIGARRSALLDAVLAECMQHEGKFLDKIIDLVWATCEESSWIDPDHNNHMHDHMLSGKIKNALPDILDYNFVDLVAGNTASLLAWTYYLLKEPLDELTPMVCERIEVEIMKRIVIPFMHHDDMTWCGFYGHKINNWNPWILNNIVCAALITVKDPDLRAKFFSRALEKLDIYIGICPADGGCDEGPGYWGAAGAALYDCFALFHAATGGKLNFFTEPLIKNIGEYIAKANLYENHYANFADNGFTTGTDCLMLYRFGRDVQSEYLKSFALSRYEQGKVEVINQRVMRGLYNLFTCAEVDALAAQKNAVFTPGCHWLPDTQTLFARNNANTVQFAAKGGFNNESHNHNDLGHFIYLLQGQPVFADLGCLPYTARTFSPYRYEIWILQSAWHSCAKINGFDQHDGDDYKAKVLQYSENEESITLQLELKGAYEAQADIVSYTRTFVFSKASGKLDMLDKVQTGKPSDDVEIHFITVAQPALGEGSVRIPVGEKSCTLLYDAVQAAASVDSHDLESDGQKKSWGVENCWRIHLQSTANGTEHTFAVSVLPEQ